MTKSPLSYGPFISRDQAQEQGLKHYFTGEPCKHGHVSTRFVSVKNCCECNRSNPAVKASRARYKSRPITERESPDARVRRLARSREFSRNYRNSKEGKAVIAKREAQPGFHQRTRQVLAMNPQRKAADAIRTLIRCQIIQNGGAKSHKTETLLGCSIAKARVHLESQFEPGMTWENHGQQGWHIDHIRPCASFDLTDPEQQKLASHYTNLQPLWAEDNLRKSDTWEPVAA